MAATTRARAKRGARKRLREYVRKRHFERTPEPRGGAKSRTGRAYVIQKHAASRLHYDFRLEHDGVLLSWAVPKGPSLDPREKRLAVQVEDHPLDYGSFEGEIPEGEYGAGKVTVWDRGRWTPDGDVDEGLRAGRLKFHLDGEKLRGGWLLVRLRPRGGRNEKPSWLLMKENDDEAKRRRDVVADVPKLDFELCTLVEEAPDGDEWLHETKWDGYRFLAILDRGEVRLLSRGGKEWSAKLPGLARTVARLPAKQLVLDGEAVVVDAHGVSRFQLLQRSLDGAGGRTIFVAFDLLILDGEDLRELPLDSRKERLERLFARVDRSGTVRRSDHEIGKGPRRLALACKRGLEGIVSKRRDSTYQAVRGRDWLKIKCRQRQEFVIAGFTEPRGSRVGLGALVLGVHASRNGSAEKELLPAGRVGTGFDTALLEELRARLDPLEVEHSPFAGRSARERGVHWVRPQLVAEIEFTEWTSDGQLRHPVFVGLREDKPATEIVREKPRPARAPRAVNERTAPREPPPRATSEEESAVLGVAITHPDREVIAKSGVTKLDLARHFAGVGERMLPHLERRPLALVRCTGGAAGPCFFQKHLDESIEGVEPIDAAKRGGKREPSMGHPSVRTIEGLVALAQRSVVEIHLWGSRADDLERPDRLVFDLDPGPGVAWSGVVAGAREVRKQLDGVGLESFALATGGKGLHVVAPLDASRTWDDVRGFAQAFARRLAEERPEVYIAKATKAARQGLIFVDYLRNGRGATAIAPFSPRARPGGPVATPLSWDEIGSTRADAFRVATIGRRLAKLRADPWARYFKVRQGLRAAALRRFGVDAGD